MSKWNVLDVGIISVWINFYQIVWVYLRRGVSCRKGSILGVMETYFVLPRIMEFGLFSIQGQPTHR